MQKAPAVVAGLVFLLVAVAHLLRVIFKLQLVVGNYSVPLRLSAVGFVVALLLALWMFKSVKGCCK